MRLLIIGGSVLDKIISLTEIKESAGGIYHTILKLQEVKSYNDNLSLCTQVSSDTFKYFKEVYDKCDEKYFYQVPKIPNVTIEESSLGYRKETYSNCPTSLNYEKIDFRKYDGILVNMITGKELDCEMLEQIKAQTNALIYFDVHTLSRLSNSDGERKFNLIPNFDCWAKNINIIQVNEFELLSLFNISEEKLVAKKLFSLGIEILIITKAEKGAIIYFNNDNELNFYFKSANNIQGVDTIGCGDYFGASFFYNYLKTKDQYSSLNFAINEVEKTLMNRFDAIKRIN